MNSWNGKRSAYGNRKRIRRSGSMNKTEEAYAKHLESLKIVGEIADFQYEPMRFRLGSDWKTTYLPDFMVVLPDGRIEFHEIKGASSSRYAKAGAYWTEQGRLKIKVAAEMYPFDFLSFHRAPKKSGGGWVREEF